MAQVSNTQPTTQRILLNISKWIAGILMIFSGIGVIFTKTFLGGLLLLVGGLLLIPPISKFLMQKLSFWRERIIRVIATFGILFLGLIILGMNVSPNFSDLKTNQSKESIGSEDKLPYQDYLEQAEESVKLLSKDKLENRNNALAELQKSSIYQKLVINEEVSPEYLILLNAISSGITHSKDDEFAVDESLYSKIQKSENGDDKIIFVTRVIGLSLPTNGGLTKELIDVFERYKKRFRWYGSKGDIFVDGNSKETKVPENYDLTPFFALIQPKDKDILNKLYEARQKGISNWNPQGNYLYPYMATKEGYVDYIKQVDPESPYIPKVDIEITASELYRAYEANEVSADEQYKGKKMAITGIVGNIGKDILDNPYLSLKVDYFQSVNCYFSDKNNKIISQISKGQKVIIIGECTGLTLTDVVVQDCELWE
ncbi:hypothetical protein [Chryseobacterium sp.]|uniref:OB-fold protein n=1 Tax=Chryseobacterium sp. TaxID=1871047 RepID=UPI002354B046|nr:hypothetical protein [Chryseobacterium sp.]